MRSIQLLALSGLAAVALASACGHGPAAADPEFLDAAPTVDAFTLAFEDGTDATGAAERMGEAASAARSIILGPSRAELAVLNQILKSILGFIEEGIKSKSSVLTKAADKHLWIIDTGQGVTLRFTILKLQAGQFGWLGEVKKTGGADSSYQQILRASLLRDAGVAGAGRGTGRLGIDLDAHAAAALGTKAAIPAQGQILVGFRQGPKGTHHRYSLREYTPDPASGPRLSRSFDVVHEFAQPSGADAGGTSAPGRTWIFSGGQQDLPDALAAIGAADDPSSLEKFHSRVRNINGAGGWGSIVAFGGNFPANTALFARECWNPAGQATYRRSWSCNYDGQLKNLSSLDFQRECSLLTASAANFGGDPANDTSNQPGDPANFDALSANCPAGVVTQPVSSSAPTNAAAIDLASETHASADDASLLHGIVGPGYQNGIGGIIGGSGGPTPPPPLHINNLCPACRIC